jgi:hypothetical protein
MRMLTFALAALGVLVAQAGADEYWITYEGNDFPENEGWERRTREGGAVRWLEDGSLALDSTASLRITDSYRHEDIRRPESGELFVAEWRTRVDEFVRYYDAVVNLARPAPLGDLTIEHATDHIRILDDWTIIDVEPGIFHEYRLESEDMDAYTVSVDGVPVYDGQFQTPSLLDPFLSFGDSRVGAASVSRWDYVRFGIVPEPGSLVLVMFLWAVGAAWLAEARTDRNGREG